MMRWQEVDTGEPGTPEAGHAQTRRRVRKRDRDRGTALSNAPTRLRGHSKSTPRLHPGSWDDLAGTTDGPRGPWVAQRQSTCEAPPGAPRPCQSLSPELRAQWVAKGLWGSREQGAAPSAGHTSPF
ncbi:hypothetical protein GHT09_015001 [Marmota monax]|uniref:Uncharacterized protein n=1 Tax=Marmota monax TaxID=9995 RepID=A0A834UJS3_MARMO|nr:hypothetical protein GHT09_015001 [Marmota monax]